LRVRKRYAGPEARRNVNAGMRFAILHDSFRVLTEGSEHIHLVSAQAEARRRDADNRVGLSVKNKRHPDRRGLSGEAALP
jgi:hypothetical protein